MFNLLDIPTYYYLIAVVIGLVMGVIRKDWMDGVLAAYLFFLLSETVLIRKIGATTGFRPEIFWSWKVPVLRRQIYTNILMFIPVGLLVGKRGWKGLLFAAGCSMVIELLQLVSRRGLFEFDDIIHNTLGAAIGIGLWMLMRKAWK